MPGPNEVNDGLSRVSMHSTREFEVGDSVNYICGDGKVEAAKYLGSIKTDIGDWHKIVLSSGEKITTDASRLTLMQQQTDKTNIPFDVETYCREIGVGLTAEEVEMMARPKSLTPLQQEYMHLHEKLYHMPFHQMNRLAKSAALPKRFAKLRNDTPICVSCQFGTSPQAPMAF